MEEKRIETEQEAAVTFARGENFGDEYALIDEGKYKEAMDLLNAQEEHTAEWHYVFAELFYKKKWFNECKKQLEIAVKLNGENSEYKATYDMLCKSTELSDEEGLCAKGGKKKRSKKQKEMGGGGFKENCAACCAACSAEFICEALWNIICNGF